jgi:hypothetical protein
MEFSAYQNGTKKTAIYPKDGSVFGKSYAYLGLAGSFGASIDEKLRKQAKLV